MNQTQIFLNGEGDAYHNRNCNKTIPSASTDIIKKYVVSDTKILELGCADGSHLNDLYRATQCMAYGIDPSRIAILEGRVKYPELNLFVGTSDDLEYPDEYFDIVYFGFCLYLVDRRLLLKSISEADRVLKDGGLIIIMDFDVKYPSRKEYKHCSGVTSYKMRYADIFTSIPDYSLVEHIPNIDIDCASIDVLRKRVFVGYRKDVI